MVISKHAQLFLLAAVIISTIVISLGITTNQARVSHEPKDFQDFSYEIKRETGAVMDYEIYTNFSETDSLDEFIDILANNIRDKDPDANFMFIYGDNSTMALKNYGSEEAYTSANESSIPGSGTGTISTICIGNQCQDISEIIDDFHDNAGVQILTESQLADAKNISVTVNNNKFSFPISRHRQIIFLMQKNIKDESFVTIK